MNIKFSVKRFFHKVILDKLNYMPLQEFLLQINSKCFRLSSEPIVEKERIEGERNFKDLNYLFIHGKRVEEVMMQTL